MMLNKVEVRPANKPRDGRHCDLCGCSQPAVRCDKCGCQIFCLSCDDMYHRHPKRRFHLRKAVDTTPATSQARPVLPMKVAHLATSPGDPSKMPLPPPRKKKPGKSFFDTFRRGSPSSDNSPPLPKKEYSWTDRLGSIKKFMSNRPLPPLPNSYSEENQNESNEQTQRHDLSFIHKKVDEKPPQLPQRSYKLQEIGNEEKENQPRNFHVHNGEQVRNGTMHSTQPHRNGGFNDSEENQWSQRSMNNPLPHQLNTLNRQNHPNFMQHGGPGYPSNLSQTMHQSASATDLQNLTGMDGLQGPGMPPHFQHYPMNAPLPPHYPYPMYPQYPNYPPYFGNSFANLSSHPTTTDGDFSDHSEASSRHQPGKKYPFRKRAKRSQSVMVDRMGYPGQYFPFGPYPPGYPPPPWGPSFPMESPPSPASSIRSLNKVGRTRRRNKMTSEDDEELSLSSSPMSRPKSSSSERPTHILKKAPLATQSTSSESSEDEKECNRHRSSRLPRKDSDPKHMPSPTTRSPQVTKKKTSKLKKHQVVHHFETEDPDSVKNKIEKTQIKDSTKDKKIAPGPATTATHTGNWQCKHCTYINTSGNKICQVCCKTATPTEETTFLSSRPPSAGSRKQSLSSEKSSSPDKKAEEEEMSTNQDKQDMVNLNTALDEAEKEISRGLEELMKLKEDLPLTEQSQSKKDTLPTQKPPAGKDVAETSKPVYKSSGKIRTSILDKLNFSVSEPTMKSTSTETQTGNSPNTLHQPMDKTIEARRASTSSTTSDAYNSPVAQSPELDRTSDSRNNANKRDSSCQTQQDTLMDYLERKKLDEDSYFARTSNGYGYRYGDRMEMVTSPIPPMYDRGFVGGFGMMNRSHSRASLFTGRLNDVGPLDYGLGPSPMYRSISRSSLTGDFPESRISEFHNFRKPDFYLSMEELAERRRQESMRTQGLELVRTIREAEQQGFTADDIQLALSKCGKQNPLEWLHENWGNMVENVINLSTNYGNDKKENDIGAVSENEAREALRMHKGNIWAAVTECVESRQRKFFELSARGKFTPKAITEALTSAQGDVGLAYSKLTKSTSKPFLMRIWGAGEGAQNQDGATVPMGNETFKSDEDLYRKQGEYEYEALSDEIWSEDEDVGWEEEADEEEDEQGDIEDLQTCHDDLAAEMITPESDRSDYCDALGTNSLDRTASLPSDEEFFVIPVVHKDKKHSSLLNKIAALRKDEGRYNRNVEEEKVDKSSNEQNSEFTETNFSDEQGKTYTPLNIIKNTISAIRDTVTGASKNEKKLPCAAPERRTIVVKDQINNELLSQKQTSISPTVITPEKLTEECSSNSANMQTESINIDQLSSIRPNRDKDIPEQKESSSSLDSSSNQILLASIKTTTKDVQSNADLLNKTEISDKNSRDLSNGNNISKKIISTNSENSEFLQDMKDSLNPILTFEKPEVKGSTEKENINENGKSYEQIAEVEVSKSKKPTAKNSILQIQTADIENSLTEKFEIKDEELTVSSKDNKSSESKAKKKLLSAQLNVRTPSPSLKIDKYHTHVEHNSSKIRKELESDPLFLEVENSPSLSKNTSYSTIKNSNVLNGIPDSDFEKDRDSANTDTNIPKVISLENINVSEDAFDIKGHVEAIKYIDSNENPEDLTIVEKQKVTSCETVAEMRNEERQKNTKYTISVDPNKTTSSNENNEQKKEVTDNNTKVLFENEKTKSDQMENIEKNELTEKFVPGEGEDLEFFTQSKDNKILIKEIERPEISSMMEKTLIKTQRKPTVTEKSQVMDNEDSAPSSEDNKISPNPEKNQNNTLVNLGERVLSNKRNSQTLPLDKKDITYSPVSIESADKLEANKLSASVSASEVLEISSNDTANVLKQNENEVNKSLKDDVTSLNSTNLNERDVFDPKSITQTAPLNINETPVASFTKELKVENNSASIVNEISDKNLNVELDSQKKCEDSRNSFSMSALETKGKTDHESDTNIKMVNNTVKYIDAEEGNSSGITFSNNRTSAYNESCESIKDLKYQDKPSVKIISSDKLEDISVEKNHLTESSQKSEIQNTQINSSTNENSNVDFIPMEPVFSAVLESCSNIQSNAPILNKIDENDSSKLSETLILNTAEQSVALDTPTEKQYAENSLQNIPAISDTDPIPIPTENLPGVSTSPIASDDQSNFGQTTSNQAIPLENFSDQLSSNGQLQQATDEIEPEPDVSEKELGTKKKHGILKKMPSVENHGSNKVSFSSEPIEISEQENSSAEVSLNEDDTSRISTPDEHGGLDQPESQDVDESSSLNTSPVSSRRGSYITPSPVDALRSRFEGLIDGGSTVIRPHSPLRRMSFNSRKAAIALERTKEPSIDKSWIIQKARTELPKTAVKRTLKQQLEIERRVRKMVADRKCRTYKKAEIVVQLMDMNFGEEEAIQAANECSTLEQAISYLQQECLLCTGYFPVSHIISMWYCPHKACRECIRAYFTVQIRDRNIMELLCPFCNEPDLTDEDIAQDYFNHLDIMLKKLVDEDIHELFQRKLRDRVLMRDPSFRWCSKCSSGFLAMPNMKRLVCPDCNAVTCASCRRPWEKEHQGISCEAFAELKDANDPEAQAAGLAKLLTEDGIDCPRCHFRYALAKGGCMHFRCIQCQHDFCSGCSRPFKMGQKCGVSEFCTKLGLHAHHPRNCLFYLRDKEPEDLQRLLDLSGIKYDSDPPDGVEIGSCQVMEQKETADGMIDDYCGKDVEKGFAGLCRVHYVEYLGQLVNKHRVDPIQIFENDDLELVLRRANIRLPPKRYRETDAQYKEKLINLIHEELPLDKTDGS